MSDTPITKTRITTIRETRHTMPEGTHKAAVLFWARRHYPQFRGFHDDEIEITYEQDGSVSMHAYKETTK